ncbi:N-acetylmuramic acid 6-phosphate etherase [Elstera cyanobacteriorum]|uniref:N-acetylmuramic acid 6-phosphate etherase n=1 Tax=Elstera cyanobacteriorum TaxID=2022747 RepID=A0A255XPJ9_9PROT|nr:N-acetylmuramic acid 6-phosphate etherase [Elstera cyanobacteriorum]OYQ18832.1 N-acetylmuramic acid 6-phosphate etherase [Elstera cyanobacteriorum]
MSTETFSPRYRDLDAWNPDEILGALLDSQFCAVAAVNAALNPLERACVGIAERLRQGGRIVYVGAGTSGRIAVQDGAELPPTFDWPRDRVVFIVAGGMSALVQSVEGAEDNRAAAIAAIEEEEIGPEDSVIGLAASGTTPFTVAAIQAARQRGALTVSIANNADSPLLHAADYPVLLDTGPEVLAGSTRLKAGTAQKIALNLISTTVMIQLGRVYDGMMVDMIAANEKLRRRSERMLQRLTDAPLDRIQAALDAANGKVKLARLLLEGLRVSEAVTLLEAHDGHLRPALAAVNARKK